MNRRLRLSLLGFIVCGALLTIACAGVPESRGNTPTSHTPTPTLADAPATTPSAVPAYPAPEPYPPPSAPVAATPVYTYTIVNTYPHDPTAYTEGLVYEDGFLYEGTGLEGQSTLRKVALESGEVLQSHQLAPDLFGEGVTGYGNTLIQLTWKSQRGFVYDKDSFALRTTFAYPTEGWGITWDGARLIMSDGTATLHFLDPATLTERSHVDVSDNGSPVVKLNELEYIQGEIYANVWQTDRIARIDPQTGHVVGWIDLTGLLGPQDRRVPVDVLNGIAYDAQRDRLFVTGKLWPKLFEIRLVAQPGASQAHFANMNDTSRGGVF